MGDKKVTLVLHRRRRGGASSVWLATLSGGTRTTLDLDGAFGRRSRLEDLYRRRGASPRSGRLRGCERGEVVLDRLDGDALEAGGGLRFGALPIGPADGQAGEGPKGALQGLRPDLLSVDAPESDGTVWPRLRTSPAPKETVNRSYTSIITIVIAK